MKALAAHIPLVAACGALRVVRSTFYRLQKPLLAALTPKPKSLSPRALTTQEQATVLALLPLEFDVSSFSRKSATF